MTKRAQRLLAALLVVTLLIGLVPALGGDTDTASAFTPAHEVIRIGLNAFRSWQTTPNVRLANTGGLRIGSYNAQRQFVPSSQTVHNSLTVTANGGTINVTTLDGTVVHSGGQISISPVDLSLTTTYTLPNASYGGNVRAAFDFFGGFRFTAAAGRLTVVNYVDLEDYLKGVVPYEMPASWPIDALKAQALPARTFAVRNLGRHGSAHNFDLSNSTWCQVYRGMHGATESTNRAVTETRGQFILHDGRPIDAVYHSTSGGATENAENVWVTAVPYLRGVPDPHGVIQSVRWTRTLTPAEFLTHMRSRDSSFNLSDIADVIPVYTEMGNMLSVTFVASNGATRTYERSAVRNMVNTGLHARYNSQRFTITKNNGTSTLDLDITLWDLDDTNLPALDELYPHYSWNEIYEMAEAGLIALDVATEEAIETMNTGGVTYTITNYGFGHNVGMSQWGARALAAAGYTYIQIIHTYYTGVTITNTTTPPPPPPPPPPPSGGFHDVSPGGWYYEPINYVSEQGLMQGTGGGNFSPWVTTTRGMFVTILGRMAEIDTLTYAPRGTINGSLVNIRSGPGTNHTAVGQVPLGTTVTITGENAGWFRIRHGNTTGYVLSSLITPQSGVFNDVAPGAFYAPYVAWAHANGVATGIGGNQFAPGRTMTRQEMAVLLYNYTQVMGITLEQTDMPEFGDMAAVATWARDAVRALQRAEVIRGMGDGRFDPLGVSNRASVASMIALFHQSYG